MKMINIITEEMIMKIIPLINKKELSFSVDENSITYEAGENDDSYVIDFYDLARFLFVDAWDYFYKKGWRITVDDATGKIWLAHFKHKGDNSFSFTDYPSRLHAMAAAVAYMWEQEEKTNEH